MSSERRIEVDHQLHDTLVTIAREHGPQPWEWLVQRARRDLGDPRIDEQAVARAFEASTLLVPTVDGRVGWLGEVLDGMVLTQRARAPLADRPDLWCTVAMQPLLALAEVTPLPLASGGEVTVMPSGEDVLVGPPGWLPDVDRHGLVGLRWVGGLLSAEAVAEEDVPGPEQAQAVRALVAHHYRRERWWSGEDDLGSRPAELVRAITLARMEDPELFTTVQLPLDELLHNPLDRDVDVHHWRDFAAARQCESVSRHLMDIPAALDRELNARARMYGMSFDQFVIAILGHLAWRTPFAEDCEPFEDFWVPDRPSRSALTAVPPPPDER